MSSPRKIILASVSAQRKKLLQMVGLKFSVRPSRVRELKKIKTTCAALVKHNALVKAEDVSRKIKKGVVISADTVVYAGQKRLILKPRGLKDARKILQDLFARAHWVYTGVAVIDVESNTKIVDYEKTKIFMHHLSDQEIRRYHRHTTPLDKAGGFDIEGKGGLFINRIEGCYSNVIGLPLAKLRLMLKKIGVSLLSLLFVANLSLILSGCATEFNLATGEEESLMYGTEKEVKIGDAVAHKLDSQVKLLEDVDVNQRVQRILDRIVEVSDRRDIIYSIKVIDEDKVNAVSLPGGHIYLFKGLIDRVKSDDQLAGVIAHEVGHITAKHGIKRLQASYGYTLLQVLAVTSGDEDVARGTLAILNSVFVAYSRRDEFQSDKLAVKYTQKAGYDPYEMIQVLKVLKEAQDKAPRRQVNYFRTHPFIHERIAIVNQEIAGEIGFKDYLNLTGNDL